MLSHTVTYPSTRTTINRHLSDTLSLFSSKVRKAKRSKVAGNRRDRGREVFSKRKYGDGVSVRRHDDENGEERGGCEVAE